MNEATEIRAELKKAYEGARRRRDELGMETAVSSLLASDWWRARAEMVKAMESGALEAAGR